MFETARHYAAMLYRLWLDEADASDLSDLVASTKRYYGGEESCLPKMMIYEEFEIASDKIYLYLSYRDEMTEAEKDYFKYGVIRPSYPMWGEIEYWERFSVEFPDSPHAPLAEFFKLVCQVGETVFGYSPDNRSAWEKGDDFAALCEGSTGLVRYLAALGAIKCYEYGNDDEAAGVYYEVAEKEASLLGDKKNINFYFRDWQSYW